MSSFTANAEAGQETAESDIEGQLNQALVDCNDCLNRSDFSGALKLLDHAVDLSPGNPEILSHRGRLLLFLKEFDRAKADFAEAAQVDPRYAPALSGLARCHFEKGGHAEAGICARRALAIDPANREAGEISSRAQAIAKKKSNEVRQNIEQFYAAARDQFTEVEPPTLNALHLKNSRILPSRETILEFMPKGGVCAEIGTQIGNFARQILTLMKPAKLHIFDIDFTPFDHAHFEPAIQRGTVELHQGDSSSLLSALPDRSFDFIYIDGDHSYDGVVKDLAAAANKIKDDGWIVCNDYTLYSPLEQIQYGVYRAVNEFCWQHGFEIVYLGLHQWSYHDVALRKMKPEDFALALASKPTPPAVPAFLPTNQSPAINKTEKPAAPFAVGSGKQFRAGELGTIQADSVIQTIGPGDEMFTGDKAHYFGVGKSALRGIENALFAANKPNAGIRRILDLPCGHGRVMRYFKAAFPGTQITACDLNRGAVDFCAQTFGAQPVYSQVNTSQIPLHGKFDLIWSGSLLTHLRAGPCAEFVRLFNSLVNPGGLIVFTLHGRWVERSLATNRCTYGLNSHDVTALLAEYYQTGFGYADYPGTSGYGISVSSPAYVLAQLVSLPDLKLISYHEKGWDNHQDIVCLQKQSPDEPLG
jgi:SAM-dependent methyltransferase